MYTAMLLGALSAAAMVCLALAVFFVAAWRGRKKNREYLVFSALLVVLAVKTVLEAVLFWGGLSPQRALDLSLLVNAAAWAACMVAPLLLHFALRYTRTSYPRRWLWSLYAVIALLGAAGVGGRWFATTGSRWMPTALPFGGTILLLKVQLSGLAMAAVVVQCLAFGAALALLIKHYRHGRGESLGALVGTALLFVTTAHDTAIAAGLVKMAPLMPLGMVALSYGVSLTLITRFGVLSEALAVRSRQLDERTQQLHASVDELTAAHEELARGERMALVGELAAVVAHQVRNPLAVIRNAISSLRKLHLRPQDKVMLQEIVSEELERLRTLVAHLLDYSRPMVPRKVRVDVRALAERSLAVVRERSDIAVEVSCEVEEGHLEGDPELLLEAFENIAGNAAQAMPGGGRIEVHIGEDELDGQAALALRFTDDGDGMTEEALEQAHRPFFTTRPTGTGLGLALVARICEAHGGKLLLDSVVSRGTTVTLTLPYVRPLVERPRRPMRSDDHISVLP